MLLSELQKLGLRYAAVQLKSLTIVAKTQRLPLQLCHPDSPSAL